MCTLLSSELLLWEAESLGISLHQCPSPCTGNNSFYSSFKHFPPENPTHSSCWTFIRLSPCPHRGCCRCCWPCWCRCLSLFSAWIFKLSKICFLPRWLLWWPSRTGEKLWGEIPSKICFFLLVNYFGYSEHVNQRTRNHSHWNLCCLWTVNPTKSSSVGNFSSFQISKFFGFIFFPQILLKIFF